MLERKHRLTASRDFGKLSTQGRSVFGPYATMRIRRCGDEAKIAFITSTKIWKKAVDRNRIKRRFRAVCRNLLSETPKNLHILFILKPDALGATHQELTEEVRRLYAKVPDALSKPTSLSPRAKRNVEKRKARTSPA
ncbi:MAG: ribonuclease P protein component [Patescibacteria group bacterium]